MNLKDKILKEINNKSECIFEYGCVGDYIKVDKLRGIINKYISGTSIKELKEPMKLFQVYVMDDCEQEAVLVVAGNKEQAEEKAMNMDWSCFMFCSAYEINEVDDYKIILELEKERDNNV